MFRSCIASLFSMLALDRSLSPQFRESLGSVLGPLLFLLCTSVFLYIKELASWVRQRLPFGSCYVVSRCWSSSLEFLNHILAGLTRCMTFGEWNWILVRPRPLYLQVTRSASLVRALESWWDCFEGVWWPGYVWSDFWFYDDLWEASSLRLRSCSSKARYHEMAGISRMIAPVISYVDFALPPST